MENQYVDLVALKMFQRFWIELTISSCIDCRNLSIVSLRPGKGTDKAE